MKKECCVFSVKDTVSDGIVSVRFCGATVKKIVQRIYYIMSAFKIKKYVLLTSVLMLFFSHRLMAGMGEYELKAHFLCNFVKYTTWPEVVDSTEAVIGVLGDNPFGGSLKKFDGKVIGGKTIRIKFLSRFKKDMALDDCHILFICNSERAKFKEIVTRSSAYPILTVGEHEWLFRLGAMVNFVSERQRIRFSVNKSEASAVDIKFSSKLLRLATEVK